MIEGRPDGTVVVEKKSNPPRFLNRRSLYLLGRRRYNLSLLEAFDQPELTSNCTRRTASAVVSQSLTLLNDDFVLQQADAFASRVENEAADMDERIARAFQMALVRGPTDEERGWAGELIERQTARYGQAPMPPDQAEHQALAHLCQMLLNTNEFLYIP